MKTYRVAIVGCRARGSQAARVYGLHPRTELVGLCDLLDERLNTLGDTAGVAARFGDLDEMIRQTKPDIVVVSTAVAFHHPLAMRALEQGVNVDVEKPMCLELDQADEMVKTARAKGVQLAVHHQWWLGPWARAIARSLQAGDIGELRYLFASGKGYFGGFGLMEMGTHTLNHLLQIGGPCQSVVAQATRAGRPIEPRDVVARAAARSAATSSRISMVSSRRQRMASALPCRRKDATIRCCAGAKKRVWDHSSPNPPLTRSGWLRKTREWGALRSCRRDLKVPTAWRDLCHVMTW